jgi:hypothetical protein
MCFRLFLVLLSRFEHRDILHLFMVSEKLNKVACLICSYLIKTYYIYSLSCSAYI